MNSTIIQEFLEFIPNFSEKRINTLYQVVQHEFHSYKADEQVKVLQKVLEDMDEERKIKTTKLLVSAVNKPLVFQFILHKFPQIFLEFSSAEITNIINHYKQYDLYPFLDVYQKSSANLILNFALNDLIDINTPTFLRHWIIIYEEILRSGELTTVYNILNNEKMRKFINIHCSELTQYWIEHLCIKEQLKQLFSSLLAADNLKVLKCFSNLILGLPRNLEFVMSLMCQGLDESTFDTSLRQALSLSNQHKDNMFIQVFESALSKYLSKGKIELSREQSDLIYKHIIRKNNSTLSIKVILNSDESYGTHKVKKALQKK
eukprot:NODE_502_length_6703_cov_1.353574.p4 type:complete len:318 gc:universal NODE_502_length_6703_cov_1.353574:6150-5197(-)